MAALAEDRSKLLLAILAVVVVGALGCLAWSLFRGDDDGGRPDGWFHCTRCGHEWSLPNAESRRRTSEAGGRMIDCPKCGAKKAAVPMATCPGCGRRYPRYAQDGQDVTHCPHCDLDIGQWYRDHPLK